MSTASLVWSERSLSFYCRNMFITTKLISPLTLKSVVAHLKACIELNLCAINVTLTKCVDLSFAVWNFFSSAYPFDSNLGENINQYRCAIIYYRPQYAKCYCVFNPNSCDRKILSRRIPNNSNLIAALSKFVKYISRHHLYLNSVYYNNNCLKICFNSKVPVIEE